MWFRGVAPIRAKLCAKLLCVRSIPFYVGIGLALYIHAILWVTAVEYHRTLRRNHLKRRSNWLRQKCSMPQAAWTCRNHVQMRGICTLGLRPHILGWIFLLFLRNKRKGKEQRIAVDILKRFFHRGYTPAAAIEIVQLCLSFSMRW